MRSHLWPLAHRIFPEIKLEHEAHEPGLEGAYNASAGHKPLAAHTLINGNRQ